MAAPGEQIRWTTLAVGVLMLAAGCDLVPAKHCSTNGDCGGGTCQDGFCFVEGIEFTGPVANGRAGVDTLVTARMTFQGAAGPPSSLKLTINGAAPVTMVRGAEAGTYEYRWAPTGTSATLQASDPVSGITSREVSVDIDRIEPKFLLQLSTPDHPIAAGGFVPEDPASPGAWKRDEKITVRILSGDSDVDPTKVALTVLGVGSTPGAPVAATKVTTGCDAGYCGTLVADLSKPDFRAFRGDMTLSLSAQDLSGNIGGASEVVAVTRYKWALTLKGTATAQVDPVLAATGRIYAGGYVNDAGFVQRIDPPGYPVTEWSVPGLVGGLTLGDLPDGGTDGLYFTTFQADAGNIAAIDPQDGTVQPLCPTTYGNGMHARVALLDDPAIGARRRNAVAAVTAQNGGSVVGVRLGEVPAQRCVFLNIAGGLTLEPRADFLTDGALLYFSRRTPTRALFSQQLFFDRWGTTSGFPLGGLYLAEMAIASPGILGAGESASFGGLFGVATNGSSGGGVLKSVSSGGTTAYGSAVDSSGIAWFGNDSGKLVKASPDAVLGTADAGDVQVPPSIGADGVVYVVTASGSIAAYGTDLTRQWEVAFEAGPAAPLLDCARDSAGAKIAGPGVLYVPAGPTKLYAIVVDSHGLQPTARWPRARHDNQNTGAQSAPLDACP